MIERIAIVDAEIAAMTIAKARQALDCQRHVAASGDDHRHVNDGLGGEPRHRGAPDVLDADAYIGDRRPGPRTKILKPASPALVVIGYDDRLVKHLRECAGPIKSVASLPGRLSLASKQKMSDGT